MEYDLASFQAGLQDLKIVVSDEQMENFLRFYELLVETNKTMNLTAITDFESVVEKHFLDSLSLVCLGEPVLSVLENDALVLDLGTGGGFPGIPLKIVYPEVQMILADSVKKRLGFVDKVITELGLEEAKTVHGRAEELGVLPDYREKFALCVSRAVAHISVLSEYCLPFVKKGGCFVAYKTDSIEEEIRGAKRGISILGGKIEKIAHFTLPNSDIHRSLVLIRKIKPTPKKYPRRPGVPKKEPMS